jgi:hypothetical protein
MRETIHIRYVPAFRDHLIAYVLATWRRAGWLFCLLAVLLVAVWGLLVGRPTTDLEVRAKWLSLFVLLGVYLVALPAAMIMRVRHQWNSLEELRKPQHLEFSDTGVLATGDTMSSDILWREIVRVEAALGIVIFRTERGIYFCVPISAFPDRAAYDAFRELVRNKVADSRRI